MSQLREACDIRICHQLEGTSPSGRETSKGKDTYKFPCGLEITVQSDKWVESQEPFLKTGQLARMKKAVQLVHGRHHIDGHELFPWTIALDFEHELIECECLLPDTTKMKQLGEPTGRGGQYD